MKGLGRAWRQAPAVLVLLLLAVALLGPLVAPGSPTAPVDLPYLLPSEVGRLGTDELGRDVLSRLLHGGRVIVLQAAAAVVLTSVVGGGLGMAAGLATGRRGELVVRLTDAVAVLPPILFLLVLGAGFPGSATAVVLGVATVSVPFSVRIVRAATRDVARSGWVETALARGDGRIAVIGRDVLPNIAGTALADAALRFAAALQLCAAASFLGLGQRPPAPDWGRMVSENLDGLAVSPWPALAPAVLLAALTVGVTLVADRIASSRTK